MAPERPTRFRGGLHRIEALRARIHKIEGRIEGGARGAHGAATVPFGIAEIDRHLPGGGLARGALHEVTADHPGAATGFCAALLARLAGVRTGGSGASRVLWCARPHLFDSGMLYGPGLARFGLAPERLVVVRAGRDADALWAMEEALRCRRIAAVLGEAANVTLTGSRRLQLAAEASGATAILLRPRPHSQSGRDALPPSAALTRWRIAAAPGPEVGEEADDTAGNDDETRAPGAPRWQAVLTRCRGGASGQWLMEWRDETGNFSLAAPVCHRPAVPHAPRLAG